MDKRAIRTPDGARDIIEYNIEKLYHLPRKYCCLDRALQDVRQDLLKLLRFCKGHDPVIWQQKYVWFIDNTRFTAGVRKRTTAATSNRHFNFLCCLGAITKLKQTADSMTVVNMTFLLNEYENGKCRPINTFTVYKYTEKQLEKMERRASELLDHRITPGNISHDKMVANGCSELAKEVFYANSDRSIQKKKELFQEVMQQLEKLCDEKGYTNKMELCSKLKWGRKKLDDILSIFRDDWQQVYQYKAPNKLEREQYSLKSKKWIIMKREDKENGKNKTNERTEAE